MAPSHGGGGGGGGATGGGGEGCSGGGFAAGEARDGDPLVFRIEERSTPDEVSGSRNYAENGYHTRKVSSVLLSSAPCKLSQRMKIPSTDNSGNTSDRRVLSTTSKRKYFQMPDDIRRARRRLDFQGDSVSPQASTSLALSQQFHDIFQCPLDFGLTLGCLSDYALNHKMVDWLTAPGDSEDKGQTLALNSESRILCRRSIKLLHNLHVEDASLDGKFSFKNFIVDKKKGLKLTDIQPGGVKEYTKERSNADFRQFALELYKNFHNGIPAELKGWFVLMIEEAATLEYLIVHNISLMDPRKAVFHFLQLYGELEVMMQLDRIGYDSVIQYISKLHPDWKPKALLNAYTRDMLLRIDPTTGRRVKYDDDAGGLLRLCRNMVAHILKESVDRDRGRHIRDKDLLAIINSVFPGLLFDLQKAIHNAGNLRRLIA